MKAVFEGAGISPEVKQTVASVLENAANIVKDSEVQPVLFVGNDSGKVVIVGSATDGSDISKDMFAHAARRICMAEKATFCIFLCESWTVQAQGKEQMEKYESWRKSNPNESLEKYEGSKEIIMVSVETLHGSWMAQLEIKDRQVSLENVDFKKLQAKGRFAQFLPIRAVNN